MRKSQVFQCSTGISVELERWSNITFRTRRTNKKREVVRLLGDWSFIVALIRRLRGSFLAVKIHATSRLTLARKNVYAGWNLSISNYARRCQPGHRCCAWAPLRTSQCVIHHKRLKDREINLTKLTKIKRIKWNRAFHWAFHWLCNSPNFKIYELYKRRTWLNFSSSGVLLILQYSWQNTY